MTPPLNSFPSVLHLPLLVCLHSPHSSHISSHRGQEKSRFPASTLSHHHAKSTADGPARETFCRICLSETLSAHRCLLCLSVPCPKGTSYMSLAVEGSVGCCETRLSYRLHWAPQQLVVLKESTVRCGQRCDVQAQVWMSPKGYPSQDLCIIRCDGYVHLYRKSLPLWLRDQENWPPLVTAEAAVAQQIYIVLFLYVKDGVSNGNLQKLLIVSNVK